MNRTAIKPTGLKGQEQVDRIMELMNQTLIKENVDRSVIELTKLGPDGRVYGIVRENHEYYIKTAENSDNLTKESFDYIGGLKNKKSFVYPSYAKAIKQLNLKFMSMCESLGIKSDVNMFINDKLVTEHHPYKSDQKLSATKGIGDAEEYVVDKAGKALSFNSKEGKAEDGFGDNVADKDVIDEFEDVKLTESETRINNILMGKGKDVVVKEGNIIVKQPLSLLSTLEKLDEVVSIVTGEKKKKQLSEAEELLQSLSKEEIMSLLKNMTVKKKL